MEELERIWNRQAGPSVEGDDSAFLSSSNNDKENDDYKTSSSSNNGSSSYSFNNNEKDNYNKDYNNYDEDDQQHRHRDQNKKRKTNSINTNTMEELERIWSRQVDSPAEEGDGSSFSSSSNNDKENDDYKTSSTSSSGSNGISSSSSKTTNANSNANSNSNDDNVVYKKRVRETTELVLQSFHKDLYEPAIKFAEENQQLQELNIELKNKLETKVREVERLRKSELRSKDIIKVRIDVTVAAAVDIYSASFYIYLSIFSANGISSTLLYSPVS